MNVTNTNEPPDLSPPSGPQKPLPENFFRNPGPAPKSSKAEVFINPNAPRIIEEQDVSPDQPESIENPARSLKKVPRIIIFGILIFILLSIVGLTVNEVFFNKITSLSLVPEDAEYYLNFSVKEHPQAKKAKELVNKLPGGEKMLESLDGYYTELLGPQDPFEDILRLAKENIFLAKLRPEADEKNSFGTGLDKLLNIVELNRSKDARNELAKFSKDPDIYDINEIDHNGQTIFNIKLKDKSSSASQRLDIGPLPSRVTLPLSEGTFATSVKNFIVAGEKISDVKKSIDLAKVKSIFGFNNSELKSIKDSPAHKKIEKYFPKETLLTVYQNQPLSPFGDFLPTQSLSQSFLGGQSVSGGDRSETLVRIPRGLTITAHDEGIDMTSYQLDIKNPDEPLKNPFKIEDSLANKLPKEFSGIVPAFYGETKNYYQIYLDQIEEIKDIAENSDNRKQRESFKEYLKLLEESRKNFRKSVGIDYEDDLLAYLDSNVATIFNAGSAKKTPEFIIVGEVKDEEKVIKSLSKINIPDYIKQLETSSQDSIRRSDLRTIATGLTVYFAKEGEKYPDTLSELTDYLTVKIPKDPSTKKPYKYTVSGDKKSATVEAKLNDGRTAYYSTITGSVKHKGVAKEPTFPPIIPKKSKYKDFEIYTMNLYSFGDYTLNMYFAAENKKLTILFSDTSESLKNILDFKDGTSEALSSNENWKIQFDGKGKIGGFSYVEPIQFWGLVEYTASLFPEYKSFITKDYETAIKGYLNTLKSIGTVVTKEKPVHVSRTFVSVVELPAEEKEIVEDAVQRLLDADKNNGYNTVLGIQTSTNTFELWKERFKQKFLPEFLR